MHKMTLERLAQRVLSDPVFRHQFLANPEVAVSEANMDLSPQDMVALKDWHAHLRDVSKTEELETALAQFLASRTSSGQ